MTVRVGRKGQVVVPKAIRERVGIRPGDDVEVADVAGEVRIRRAVRFGDLRGVLGPPVGMGDWEAEKTRERAAEERRARGR